MTLARRISAIKPSPTLAFNSKAKALAAGGVEVINFAVGEPDYPTPPAIVDEAIKALRQGKTKYGPSGGGVPLRNAIAAKLKAENELTFSAEDIVVGMGAKEILFHIFLSTMNDGDEALLTAPYWVSYSAQVTAAGGSAVVVPLDVNQPFPMPEVLESYTTAKTKVLVLNSPNNPAGCVHDRSYLQSLGNYLLKKDWWIISDEIYEYLVFDKPHLSLLNTTPELKDRFILVNGLSKSFAMTGWRVGYTAGPAAVMKLVRNLQSHSSSCLPPFIEEAAIYAVKMGRKLVSAETELMKKRRDLAVQLMKRLHPRIPYLFPDGAFYLFMDIRLVLSQAKPGKGAGIDSSLSFANYLLETHHVAMIAGEDFGVPGFLRMSYAASEKNIEQGLNKLKDAIARLT